MRVMFTDMLVEATESRCRDVQKGRCFSEEQSESVTLLLSWLSWQQTLRVKP